MRIVGLLATGGSTNHTLHLVAMAHAAGIRIDWDDFSDLSDVVPLLARIYPNGTADVNHFHAAGGMGFLIRELLGAGLLHADVTTVMRRGPRARTRRSRGSSDGGLAWRDAPADERRHLGAAAGERSVQRRRRAQARCSGNLGRAVIKMSAVKPQHRVVEAPARVFDDQEQVIAAFKAGALTRDVRRRRALPGPARERHAGAAQAHAVARSLQNKGFKVALITDGRMSGASGAVPAAIHVTPECLAGGPLGKVRDGDIIRLDSYAGVLEVRVPGSDAAQPRRVAPGSQPQCNGVGRELFATFRVASDANGRMSCRGCQMSRRTLRSMTARRVLSLLRPCSSTRESPVTCLVELMNIRSMLALAPVIPGADDRAARSCRAARPRVERRRPACAGSHVAHAGGVAGDRSDAQGACRMRSSAWARWRGRAISSMRAMPARSSASARA